MKRVPCKIIHLSKYYPPNTGGIETHVQTLARAQADLGADVSVLCVNGCDRNGHPALTTETIEERDENVQIMRVGRLTSLARFDVCPELYSLVNRFVNQPDVTIHVHTPNPTMLTALMALKLNKNLIVTHHSDIIKQRILKYAVRPIEHLVYQQASSILTTSFAYIQGSKFLKLYLDKLSYLPLGLDCSSYLNPSSGAIEYANSLRKQYPNPLWLCVGRLVPYKALHVAIDALKSLPGTLMMIGTGVLEKQLKQQARKLGVENRIVWHGYANSDQLVGAYHAATALLFPSNLRSEGFGMVQVEAMASGCPVINTDIPGSGVSWVCRHEKEGLTVPRNDSTALAQAALRLLKEPSLRDRLSQAGRDRARQEFGHLTMAQRSFEIYEQARYSPETVRKPALVQAE